MLYFEWVVCKKRFGLFLNLRRISKVGLEQVRYDGLGAQVRELVTERELRHPLSDGLT